MSSEFFIAHLLLLCVGCYNQRPQRHEGWVVQKFWVMKGKRDSFPLYHTLNQFKDTFFGAPRPCKREQDRPSSTVPNSRNMGASSSKPPLSPVVTLGTRGTLYKARKPVASQYGRIARECGFKGEYTIKQLDQSFRSALQELDNLYSDVRYFPTRYWKTE